MSQPSSDRNLLFGILALQMDFISRDALITAMQAWMLDKAKLIGHILHEQGQLGLERLQLLEALVAEHLRAHGGDAQQSLASLSSVSSVRQALRALDDPELHASLAVAGVSDPGHSPESTVDDVQQAGPRFRILRPHAKGGLGAISVAEDLELHREVALKEIQERHADDPHSRGRFLLEAEITGGLEHPGIVPVYSLGAYADGRPFYAMRFIKGDNLMEAIQRFHDADQPGRDPGARSLAFRQMLGRFVDVCQAVAYAHSRGVLHRDLKPGNIMLGKYGETLVVDWGLAKVAGRVTTAMLGDEPTLRPPSDLAHAATQVGSALGTPEYISPEQAAGRLDELGPANDVYSLGATLYVLLTGQAPFRRQEDVGETLRQVQRGEFPKPRALKRDVPAALEAICLKAMALRPGDRYDTALALAAEVEHWLADEPVSAYPEPWRARAWRWLRRHPAQTAAGVATLLAAVVVAVVVAVLSEHGRQAVAAERDATEFQRQKAEASAWAEQEANETAQKRLRQLEKSNRIITGIFANLDMHEVAEGLDLLPIVLGRRLTEAAYQLEDEAVGDPLVVASLQLRLGVSLGNLGDQVGAIHVFAKARKTLAANVGHDHPDTRRSTNALALAYLEAGQPDQALPLIEASLKFSKAKYGSNDFTTLRDMNLLAVAYNAAGQLDRALPLYEETLKLCKAKLTGDNRLTLTCMNNLASAYRDAGQLDRALPLLEETLELTKVKHGPDDSLTLASMSNLARGYKAARQFDRALRLLQEVARCMEKRRFWDKNAGRIVNDLSDCHELLRQYDQAEAWRRRWLAIVKARAGVDALPYAAELAALSRNLNLQKKWTDAEVVLRDCLAIREQREPDAWTTFNTKSLLGEALLGQKQYTEAEPLLLSGYEGLKARVQKIPATSRNRLAEAVDRLVRLYDAWGQPEKAGEWLRVRESLPPPAKPKPPAK